MDNITVACFWHTVYILCSLCFYKVKYLHCWKSVRKGPYKNLKKKN